MTKARARERAKAKAGQKAKKRAAQADQPDTNTPPGKFDPGSGSINKPGGGTNNANFAEARRGGSARSR
ncbi:MAG: hypothetical protein HOL07_14850 [Rhodospirillaceae bacterium]|jgi:hypothetical protein|nr:hypothetical protein [Rhodospirillaceae bacterium]MBT3810278.1 hypothetical protein [Rhodospirillaceae bacterium]MBT3929350.1 hypothetical protein [Rhodospirillaceae bacterium]MBT4772330.1 hypothetical protein [Rhodospirillaceae bacterium]MBT5359617.1 hypothetical protein [Rhodospirillaceae bacterium]